jgi:hypothetical protein
LSSRCCASHPIKTIMCVQHSPESGRRCCPAAGASATHTHDTRTDVQRGTAPTQECCRRAGSY